jgi:hypothetical protein
MGGYIWESLGPECVFMIPIFIDMPARLQILSTVTETLNRDQNAQFKCMHPVKDGTSPNKSTTPLLGSHRSMGRV